MRKTRISIRMQFGHMDAENTNFKFLYEVLFQAFKINKKYILNVTLLEVDFFSAFFKSPKQIHMPNHYPELVVYCFRREIQISCSR